MPKIFSETATWFVTSSENVTWFARKTHFLENLMIDLVVRNEDLTPQNARKCVHSTVLDRNNKRTRQISKRRFQTILGWFFRKKIGFLTSLNQDRFLNPFFANQVAFSERNF